MYLNQKSLQKIIDIIHHTADKQSRESYILYYINQLLGTEKTLFLGKKQIPKRGLTREVWQLKKATFVNNVTNNEKYSKTYDPYLEDIYSLLLYPINYQNEYIGMIACIGKESYMKTEDKMLPLKSGETIIGVSVKQVNVEIPAHTFTDKDITLINEVLPTLLDALYFEKTEQVEKSLADSSSVDTEQTIQKKGFFHNTFNKMKKILTNNI